MPLYEFECESCHRRFERIQQKFSDPPPDVCPHCGQGPIRKLMSTPAIQFKGSGFYITDYGKKGSDSSSGAKDSASEAGKKDSASTGGNSESTKSESTKSESGKSESTKSESTKTESSKSESKPETSKKKE